MGFKIVGLDGEARNGLLSTNHGAVSTPMFMPVATKATGKFITTDDYRTLGADAIISNAYLLSLNPGIELISSAGGLHKFMSFKDVIFTDCGGFQMLRTPLLESVTDKGIIFRNQTSNKKEFITPEKIMKVQMSLGSDVAMALDDVAPYGADYAHFAKSLNNTHRWAEESLKHHIDDKQLLFGIVQGGTFEDLRIKSAKHISKLNFDGVALGGLSIGEPDEKLYRMVDVCVPHIPDDKPRYLMGLGSPVEMLECVSRGIDIFDSIYPTRVGRHRTLFTSHGKINIKKRIYSRDFSPIDENCSCFICKNYSRAYLHHLVKIKEPAFKRYASYHNLHFLQSLMDESRKRISEGTFTEFKKSFISAWCVGHKPL